MNSPSKTYRVLISAGETSGDLHASALIKQLQAQTPEGVKLEIAGIAGALMQVEGCVAVRDMSELNVMGFGDVIRALPRIKAVERDIVAFAAEFKPDMVILTDFTSFHLSLGRKLRAQGLFVTHYIAPKLWAWGAKRITKLQKSQNRLACIFPFEQQWFTERGIPDAQYVGNPSAYACQGGWSKAELKQRLGLEESDELLALLPGSRPGELKKHVQLLADTYVQLKQARPELKAVATLAPSVKAEALKALTDVGVLLLERTENNYALRADAAIAVSGTATLELALWNTPTVLVYKTSAFSWFIGQRLIKGRCVGLANILLLGDAPSSQGIVPELLQHDATIENIEAAVIPLLYGETQPQLNAFAGLQTLLGANNPAEKLAALCWAEMVK
ncbi:MAG: lipid-A-disaccharide synthase [Ghiorsea sp.]|nr:lipid-A-disaccharide synthase [Ghiorsea sp.]MDQ7057044.1 lipid-A-disaccharide synthase [Ghiorsea sp.]